MDNKNPILEELKDISPFVAAIGNQHPYTVPQSYFDGLAVQVMLKIALEEKTGADPVLNISKETVYEVPSAYFEGLAGSILNRIKAQETQNPKEELELLSPLLGRLEKKHPFTAPEGFFTDFSDNIVAGVKAVDFVNEELENLSPLMRELKDKLVYTVPDSYFENNIASILARVKQQQPAKVVSIGFGKKFMRYAAAAVVTGIIAISGYVFSTKTSNHTGIESAASTTWDSASVAAVTDQEIENFLSNNTTSVPDSDTSAVNTADDISTTDAKDLLANISDEELQQYADQQHLETPITN